MFPKRHVIEMYEIAHSRHSQSTVFASEMMMKVERCLLFALVVALVSADLDGAKGKKDLLIWNMVSLLMWSMFH